MFPPRISYWLLGLTLLCCAGCGEKGPQRYQFAGKITHQGQPIPAGIIYFDPQVPENDGPQGHATIQNGQFDTKLDGNQGPGSGKYLARVYAHDGIASGELPMGQLLFPEVIVPVDLPQQDGPLDIVVPPQPRAR